MHIIKKAKRCGRVAQVRMALPVALDFSRDAPAFRPGVGVKHFPNVLFDVFQARYRSPPKNPSRALGRQITDGPEAAIRSRKVISSDGSEVVTVTFSSGSLEEISSSRRQKGASR